MVPILITTGDDLKLLNRTHKKSHPGSDLHHSYVQGSYFKPADNVDGLREGLGFHQGFMHRRAKGRHCAIR